MATNERPLKKSREQRYQKFFEVVDEVVEQIQSHEWEKTGRPKRRLRGEQLDNLRASVETLIRDSVAAVYQRKRKGEASVHLNANWYSSPASPPELTHSIHVLRAFHGMLELGYLEQTKRGVYDRQGRNDGTTRSRLTRYIASDRLIDKFTAREQETLPVIVPPAIPFALIRVQTKASDGHREMYPAPNTPNVQLMQMNLEKINRVLDTRWYDLEIPDTELNDLQARLSNDQEDAKPLYLNRRSLYRVFNDKELESGGRFYGGWWQNVPKEYRRLLVVNGKRMIEVDYSNLHPAILYGEVEAVPAEDCYTGIFKADTERKGGEALRNLVKAAFNAMLNAERPLSRPPRGVDPRRFDLTWREVSQAIIAAHEPIAHCFFTGAGKRLQRKDSDVAENVMLDFIDYDIPILPIHDSFLVHEGYSEKLEHAMRTALSEVCGIETKMKLVEPDLSRVASAHEKERLQDPEGFGEDTTLNIAEILKNQIGHDKRLDAFLHRKQKR